MLLGGIDAVQVLGTIQARNDAIRQDFLLRNRLLNQIRSDIYLSGTFVRDYLLEPDPHKAEPHRDSLRQIRQSMEGAIGEYESLLSKRERNPFQPLERQLNEYWQMLEPVMLWNSEKRRESGYTFVRDEVYSRRAAMLNIADQAGALNEQQLNARDAEVGQLFSEFRKRLTATLLVMLCLGTSLALYSIIRLLKLEAESNQRFEEIAKARSEMKELSARLVLAQEDERRNISRELHDEVGQTLTALLVGMGNFSSALPQPMAPALETQMEGLRGLAQSAVRSVRSMALLLRPSMLDDLGLLPALQWQAREMSKRSGVIVDVASDSVPDDLADVYKTAVYRVVQEALHNCEQHAGARQIRVAVRRQDDSLVLSIQDDGRGFDTETNRGMGLIGMQERIATLGGAVSIDSEVGRGTLILVRLPYQAAEHPIVSATP
jgi:signal transduction histidine kinase